MNKILAARQLVYDEFHRSAGPNFFFKAANEDSFVACYTSMFLIADTGESIDVHRRRDFSPDPLASYLEFWGVMQAVIIQQDAIGELHKAVVGNAPVAAAAGSAWRALRELRIQCAGHPANRSQGVPAPQRSFMGRMPRTYQRVQYETWDAHTQSRTHPIVNLGQMLDDYDVEASSLLISVLQAMKVQWP